MRSCTPLPRSFFVGSCREIKPLIWSEGFLPVWHPSPRAKTRHITEQSGEASSFPFISKFKFLWGLQCHRPLWHAYNAKHLIPEPDASQQAIFDQGHEVGALAKTLFPAGIEVGEGVTGLEETIRLTAQALKLRIPLFEAAFTAKGGYCRVEFLRPTINGAWDIIEVKSTTSLKAVHLDDLTFQAWVLTSAGLKGRGCFLCHINPDFVRRGEIDPQKFFVLEHIMFLAEGRHDPRPECMFKLRDAIGRTGSIVAYNASFEIGRLRECCEVMPNFSTWLKGVEDRVVDLLDPFKSFAYYHPASGGSASMKAVLPALTGKGYEGLAIQEGGAASREFLRVTFGEVPVAERQRVRRQLEDYCGQDTQGMVWIVDALAPDVGHHRLGQPPCGGR